jgi:hypothetical protein
MRSLARVICLALFLSAVSAGQNQTSKPPAAPPAKQKPTPGFIDRVLKYLGISDSPGTLKGPGDEVVRGDIWVANLNSNATHVLAKGSYRSPVFKPGNDGVLALSGTQLMRFSPGSGDGEKLYSIPGVTKLVGFSSDDPDNLLLLRSNGAGGHPQVASISISTGKITSVDYDPASSADLQMVENLEGWTRTYGEKQIYVRRQTKQALSGTVEWSEVFLRADRQDPVNVSRCDGANCGQPSLSADGQFLIFVKAEPE